MQDLNDFYIFSQVVDHNGFSGAARALGVARSSICRRVAQLEQRLGIRLVQRTTRRFAVTEVGMVLYGHSMNMVAEARAAYEKVACARGQPSGVIRLSCPASIAQLLVGPLLPLFVEKHPGVRIAIEATDRRVDISEGFDLSIRIERVPSRDSGMVMRSLGIVQQVLVASPRFLDAHERPTLAAAAARLPTVSYGSPPGPHVWRLIDSDEREIQVRHDPRLVVDDIVVVHQAVVQGMGIAQLPLSVCLNDLRSRNLELVLPELPVPLYEIQVLFPSRQGMLPAVRSFIDFLAAHCVRELPEQQIKRHAGRDGAGFWISRQPLSLLLQQDLPAAAAVCVA